MKLNYKPLSDLIEEVDERNINNSIDQHVGLTIGKNFISSIANTIGTDLTNYKIVKTDDFVVSLMQVGRDKKVPIACFKGQEAIATSAYRIFRVKDKSVLLPDFLDMWFKRAEFDREATFIAVGGVRASMSWDDFLTMQVPVPSIERQASLVRSYKTVADRILLKQAINDNLEAQAFAIYKDFTKGLETSAPLSDIAIITMGTSPEGESFNTDGKGDVFYQGRTDFGFRFPTIRLFTTNAKRYAKAGDVLMSVRAPVGCINLAKEDCAIGRGLASFRPKDGCYSFLYYTMQELNFELKKFNDEGTVFGSITKEDLFNLKIVPLDNQRRREFERIVASLDTVIKANEYEIFYLQDVCSIMFSKLAH